MRVILLNGLNTIQANLVRKNVQQREEWRSGMNEIPGWTITNGTAGPSNSSVILQALLMIRQLLSNVRKVRTHNLQMPGR